MNRRDAEKFNYEGTQDTKELDSLFPFSMFLRVLRAFVVQAFSLPVRDRVILAAKDT